MEKTNNFLNNQRYIVGISKKKLVLKYISKELNGDYSYTVYIILNLIIFVFSIYMNVINGGIIGLGIIGQSIMIFILSLLITPLISYILFYCYEKIYKKSFPNRWVFNTRRNFKRYSFLFGLPLRKDLLINILNKNQYIVTKYYLNFHYGDIEIFNNNGTGNIYDISLVQKAKQIKKKKRKYFR